MIVIDENPWDGILVSAMFALCATVNTTMQQTSEQLVFGQDLILNTRFESNWQFLQKHKHELINKRNKEENCNHKEHMYQRVQSHT